MLVGAACVAPSPVAAGCDGPPARLMGPSGGETPRGISMVPSGRSVGELHNAAAEASTASRMSCSLDAMAARAALSAVLVACLPVDACASFSPVSGLALSLPEGASLPVCSSARGTRESSSRPIEATERRSARCDSLCCSRPQRSAADSSVATRRACASQARSTYRTKCEPLPADAEAWSVATIRKTRSHARSDSENSPNFGKFTGFLPRGSAFVSFRRALSSISSLKRTRAHSGSKRADAVSCDGAVEGCGSAQVPAIVESHNTLHSSSASSTRSSSPARARVSAAGEVACRSQG
eukprot:scaffold1453_cov112-Isochrysis_galbana.AAC.11